MANLELFWANYGTVVVVSVFWLIVFLIYRLFRSDNYSYLEEELCDMAESNRWNMEKVCDTEVAWLAARNEVLKLRRENQELRDFVSRKKEFRLRNGLWCTEEQYLAEKNGLSLSEQIVAIDANEEANRQIDFFMAESERKYTKEEKDIELFRSKLSLSDQIVWNSLSDEKKRDTMRRWNEVQSMPFIGADPVGNNELSKSAFVDGMVNNMVIFKKLKEK